MMTIQVLAWTSFFYIQVLLRLAKQAACTYAGELQSHYFAVLWRIIGASD